MDTCLDLQTGSLARLHPPPEGDLGRNLFIVFHTDPGCNGVQLRRITYTDPRDGTHYTYLANEMTLPAHLLVIIYKCRWDIEKVFGELKWKMEERKSWASSPEAKRAHGQFECLAHNLTLLSEREMKLLGLEDEMERKKGIRRGKTRRNREGWQADGGGREFHRTGGLEGDAEYGPVHPLAA